MTSSFLDNGTKVRCLSSNDWSFPDGTICPGPALDEIVTIRKTAVTIEDGFLVGTLWFEEYEGDGPDDGYDMEEFFLA